MTYGNFSDTSDNTQSYNRLLFEQGQLITDSMLNQLAAIHANELQQLTKSVFPWHGSGEVEFNGDTGLFSLSPFQFAVNGEGELKLQGSGNYFVDGLRFESNNSLPHAPKIYDGDSQQLWDNSSLPTDRFLLVCIRGWQESRGAKLKNRWRLEGYKRTGELDNHHRLRVDRSYCHQQFDIAAVSPSPPALKYLLNFEADSSGGFAASITRANCLARLEYHESTVGLWKWDKHNGSRLVRGKIQQDGNDYRFMPERPDARTISPDALWFEFLSDHPDPTGAIAKARSRAPVDGWYELDVIDGELSSGSVAVRIWEDVFKVDEYRIAPNPVTPNETLHEYRVSGDKLKFALSPNWTKRAGDFWSFVFRNHQLQAVNQVPLKELASPSGDSVPVDANVSRSVLAPIWLVGRNDGGLDLIDLRIAHMPMGIAVAETTQLKVQPPKFSKDSSKAKAEYEEKLADLRYCNSQSSKYRFSRENLGLEKLNWPNKIVVPDPVPDNTVEEDYDAANAALTEAYEQCQQWTLPAHIKAEWGLDSLVSKTSQLEEKAENNEFTLQDSPARATLQEMAIGSCDETKNSCVPKHIFDDRQLANILPIDLVTRPLKQWLASATVGAIRKEPSLNSLTAKICRTVDVADSELPDFERELAAIYKYVHSTEDQSKVLG